MALSVGSLFSGIGGFELGLERAGMHVKWQVEIDPYCTKVLEKHWPNVKRYRDVREVGRHNLERVDLICGGFPCQDLSVAGNQAGIEEGTRSGLWLEYARIVREIRPRWVLVENVPGLLSANAGRGMGRVLGDLAELGFDAEWHVLPAAAFGAPHLRERVWIVAYNHGGGGRRLVASQDISAYGSGWKSCQAHLQSIYNTPFEPGDSWPQPLLRRMDDGLSSRMDRTHCLGNAIHPACAEWIGRRIMEAVK